MCPTAVYKAVFVVTSAILNFLLFHFIIITLQNGLISLILAKHETHIDTDPVTYPDKHCLPAPYSNNYRLCRSREPDVHPSRLRFKAASNHPNPEQLTGKEQADYALLLTQAKSRNRIYATSDSLIRIAVDYYQNSDEMGQKAKSLLYLGDVLMDMERYTDATLPLKQAKELMEHVSDRQIQSMIYSNLGYLNRQSNNYELALSYYQKAIYINRLYGFTERLVSNIMNILNLPIKEPTDSIPLYIKELEESLNTVSKKLQFQSYNNIGVYYKEKKKLKQAESYFIKAIQIADETPYRSYKNLADIYIAQGKEHQADSLYNEALKSPVWATKAKVYENIYKRKLKLGLTEEATHYMNAYIQAADSFYTHRESEQIQKIQQKYDQEVILRQKDQIVIWLYRIVFSFIMLTGMLATYAWYLKKKSKAHLQALQEQINKITLSSESDKAEISRLNEMLAQSNVLKQALQFSTMEDLQALELYLRILQAPESLHTKNDFKSLKHWLDLSQNNFASRLKDRYPYLSPVELTLCCLLRMGYTLKQTSTMMKVQDDTIRRNIYRACTHMNINNEKEKIREFITMIRNL